MSDKPWDGRFSQKTDKIVEAFTSSIMVDKRLYAHDIEGSIAHSRMLANVSIITGEEASLIEKGLLKIEKDIESGKFEYDDSLEDIHMHIESRLAKDIGKVALKLHTARSRNDQVALDVRMYLRDEVNKIISGLIELRKVIIDLCAKNTDTIMPGYTHLQKAQPVLFSHHLMAYYEMFLRDTERMRDCFKRINVMPLGSAALAGTTYPIDRNYTAKLLGFPKVTANSMDSVADRDFIIEFISSAAICMVHFSRFSEDLIIWSSYEFGFIELPDAFATGSSIMPQKKNPDVCELVRGKSGRIFGDLISMLTIMKSLPLSYNRDMQEDKIAMFDAVDTLTACIEVYTRMLPELKINKEVMLKASSSGFLNATDLADYLTIKGMPFREAHSCAGKAVAFALKKGKELHELSLDEIKTFSNLFSDDVFEVLTPASMINRRKSSGGTATGNVLAAIKKAKKDIAKEA
ncbi:argininosuccinate lyase [Desulfobacterium sp. N47]|uniref:Argininosuccinate lyase n=1 Tax=uncultured Desulfobacterium sp. TaxID=201089 RepID=E1YBL0_9BACT|nr:Argininosuccinate lyase [uncultured Desulfobacterium sp.]